MGDQSSTAKKIGFGVVLGTLLGGIAAFFLSPKSGKENREMVVKKYGEVRQWLEDQNIDARVQEIFGEVSAEGRILYTEVRVELLKLMNQVKDTLDTFDTEKYVALVDEAIGHLKKEVKSDTKKVEQLKKQLISEWENR